ncbi:MAG: AmmeMemoRadiSam system protein B [Candidatus Nanopelagicales bacterium]
MSASEGRTGAIREAAVAGRFYTGGADRLAAEVDGYLEEARAAGVTPVGGALKAIVVPHAGHIYSGPIAAYSYAAIDASTVERVVLLGPAHFIPVDGIGVSSARAWRTPLGDVPLDGEVAADLRERFGSVHPADTAHAPEHSLEVQVPFLQRVLKEGWRLVPLLVGSDIPDEVAALITRCAELPGTLIVVSTDLSHYMDYEAAIARDARTIRAILDRNADGIGDWDACGRHPLRGLLRAAAANGWTARLLDARNSGDTAGDRDRVVGYSAIAFVQVAGDPGAQGEGLPEAGRAAVGSAEADESVPANTISAAQRAQLLALARRTIEDALETGRRPRFEPHGWDRQLLAPGAAFVTLRSPRGQLLGCIGSLTAVQALVADVAEHAFDAAFRDPRFPPLTRDRAEGMVIDISVLTPSRPFPCSGYDDLLARVPRGSGLVVSDDGHRATFLPAVWRDLQEPRAFLAALWRKAGLAPGHWSAGTRIEVYDSEEFAEGGE